MDIQGWGAGYFLAAPAPDFFSKRLRLQGAKNTRLRHLLPSPSIYRQSSKAGN